MTIARLAAFVPGSAVAAALVLLAGCAGRTAIIASQPTENFAPPDAATRIETTQQYRLGPGDVVTVRVYRAEEVSGDHQIDEQGQIDVPLVGRITALGTTPGELAETIEEALGRRYYQNPQVDVSIKDARGRRVTIDGAVRTPGIYPVDSNTTLLRAITLAQGTTDEADNRRVAVFRTIDGQRQAAVFDLKAIREGRADDPTIYGSDVIVVDGDNLRIALRNILQALPLIAIFRPF